MPLPRNGRIHDDITDNIKDILTYFKRANTDADPQQQQTGNNIIQ